MVLTPTDTPLRQFDLRETPEDIAHLAPYFVILQDDWFDALETVIVAPVRAQSAIGVPLQGLHVCVTVGDERLVVTPEELVSLPRTRLGPRVGSLANYRDALVAALDRLFLGL